MRCRDGNIGLTVAARLRFAHLLQWKRLRRVHGDNTQASIDRVQRETEPDKKQNADAPSDE